MSDPYGFYTPIGFTVTTDGKIGIGTTLPSQKLHVLGNIYATGDISACNITIRGDTTILYTLTSNTEPLQINNTAQGTAFTVTSSGAGATSDLVSVTTPNGINALRILPNGNVGIGSTLPNANLQVVGTLRCTQLFGDASGVTGLAASAKTDTTNATNISSGTLAAARVSSTLYTTGFAGNVGIGSLIPNNPLVIRGASEIIPPMIPPAPMVSINQPVMTPDNCGIPRLTGTYVISSSVPSSIVHYAFDAANGGTTWDTTAVYNPTYIQSTTQIYTINQAQPLPVIWGEYLQIQCPTPIYLHSYAMTSHSPLANTPGSWVLLGSTNGATNNWYAITSQTDFTWPMGTSVLHTFPVSNPTPYQYFRMVFTKLAVNSVPSASILKVSNLRLYGDTKPYEGLRVQGPLTVAVDRGLLNDGTSSAPWFYIEPVQGNVGIGTSNPQSKVHIQGGPLRVTNLSGTGVRSLSVDALGNLTPTPSDERLKTDITPLSYGLKEILQLNPVHFHWKDQNTMGSTLDTGLLAQEVAKIMPELVTTMNDAENTLSLDYAKLVPVLIKAIQELAQNIMPS